MRLSLIAGGLLAAATALHAQPATSAAAVGPTLSLDEAISIARRNNPTYLQSTNQRRTAAARVRSAYGALAPSLSSSFGTSFREGRQALIEGQAFGASSDQLTSSASLSAFASYGAEALLTPKAERANAEAVEADITGAAQTLRTNVTTQYLAALQQAATASLQDSLVATTQAQLDLAKAKVAVGAATILDVRRAEVALGTQRVQAIRAHNQAQVEKLRLFQQIGVTQPSEVQLTSQFTVTDPTFVLSDLLDQARRGNPGLLAQRTREHVADVAVKGAKGTYLPTLNLSAGLSGAGSQFTNSDVLVSQALSSRVGQCQSMAQIKQAVGQPADPTACQALSLSPSEISAARSRNPGLYDFTRNPYSVSASLSLPIFNGFQREQRVQQAIAQRNDAEYAVRRVELQTTADVTAAHLTLQAARQTVALQEQNAATAREALNLAQERYRVGANTFIEVSQARDDYARAQTDLINAVYDFHRSFAALENAVGRPLR
jgi:outer membrane protein